MWNFIKMVLAAIFGFFIAGALIFLLFIGIIAGMSSSMSKKEKQDVKPNSILKLNINTEIKEQEVENPLGKLTGNATQINGLNNILEAIEYAKTDDKIKGIYIPMSYAITSYANISEIRNALLDFKTSGKFIIAYGEIADQKNYYLASVADSIYLNPSGLVEFKGLSSQIMFLQGALEKLEIDPKIFYCGKYKSATEPLRRKDMSPENELQTEQFMHDMYTEIISAVSISRKLDTTLVDSIADNMLVQEPEDAVKYKLIDGLKYEDEVLKMLASKTGIDEIKDLSFVNANTYGREALAKSNSASDKIAVLYAEGDITSGKSKDGIGSEDFVKTVRKIKEDDKIKGVLLRISSPGGSALASDVMWRELKLLKEKKPLYVSMGTYAASGGYYLSCIGDTIVAEPTTITGSIGVFGVMANLSNLFNHKLGVTFDGVKTGKYSDLGNMFRDMTPEEEFIIQKGVNKVYADFKLRVSEGRGMDTAAIQQIAQGRVWTGKQAIKNGLVDVLGTKKDALNLLATKLGLKEYKLVEYPKKKDLLTEILADFKEEEETKSVRSLLGPYYNFYQTMQRLQDMDHVQARMLFEVDIK